MTSTVDCAPSTPHSAVADAHSERLRAFDHMRGFVVGLVVLHHATLAYCTFGHIDRVNYARSTAPIVDPQRWVGFDLLVRLDDGFFMPLLFLLSGLFVRDGLIRHGPAAFLGTRIRRLGLPFAIAILTVGPLAYYPSFLQAGGTPGFGSFWIRTVTAGPWPSGPPWFIGVLLLFDVAATLLFILASRCIVGPVPPPAPRAVTGFALLFAGSWLLYLPLLLALGPTLWLGIGPLAVQGSRIGLYAGYFAAGVGLGCGGMPAIVQFARRLSPRWAAWSLLAALTGAAFLTAGVTARWGLHRPAPITLVALGTMQVTFCAAASFGLLALFLRFGGGRSAAWDSLAANSFAIYLLHYPLVTWTQYGLLATRAGAPMKGAVVFSVALTASWACASSLRRLPVVGRIL